MKTWRVALGVALVVFVALVLVAVRAPYAPDPANHPGHNYPPEVAARFAASCERTGTHATCVCLYGNLEARYSYRQFQALVAADDPEAPEYAVVARQCVGR